MLVRIFIIFLIKKDLNVFTLSRRHTINSKNNFSVDLRNEKSIDAFFKNNQKFDEIIYSAYYHSENLQDIHNKNIEMFSNLLSSVQKTLSLPLKILCSWKVLNGIGAILENLKPQQKKPMMSKTIIFIIFNNLY